jgi:hypothetical protein
MLERKRLAKGTQPENFYTRTLDALNKAVIKFEGKSGLNEQDLGQAQFRRNELERHINEDRQLSWEEVMLAGVGFSMTLRLHKKHLFEDDAFLSFLREQAVHAAERDGIVIQSAIDLQPQLPGIETQDVVDIQSQIKDAVIAARSDPLLAQREINEDGLSENDQSVDHHISSMVEPTSKISKRAGRRRLLNWLGAGGVGVASLGGFGLFVKHIIDESERLNPYEQRNKLTDKFTEASSRSNLQFRYPQIEPGWELVNRYGDKAVYTVTSADTSMKIALPWDNSEFPNKKIAALYDIRLDTFTDSSGKVVPKIIFDSLQGRQERVLVGHLTAPEGSYARDHSDVVEMFVPNNDADIFLSMTAEEKLSNNGWVKEKNITITTLEKVQK